MSTVPPPDPAAHQDFRLLHDMTVLNTGLARYVMRFLDADAERAESPSITDELALADKATAVAIGLRARVSRHRGDGPALHICPPPPLTK